MPIYEYTCSACGHQFEKLVRVRAPAPPCPECASEDVNKNVSASGFILKGGGWYKDHYGLKSSSGDSKGSDSSSKASDSKPAASSTSSTSAKSGD